jgi:hypothetical protein
MGFRRANGAAARKSNSPPWAVNNLGVEAHQRQQLLVFFC